MTYIHTDPLTSRVFKGWLAEDWCRPHLLVGPTGTGKTTAYKTFIAEQNCIEHNYNPFSSAQNVYDFCECQLCTRIRGNKSADILVLSGTDPIDTIRSSLTDFWHVTPKELKYKYLIIRQLGLASKDVADTFLRLLESPPSFLQCLLTTASLATLPAAITSRARHTKHHFLTPEQLRLIVSNNPIFQAASKYLDNFAFHTTRELLLYARLDLDKQFQLLCTDTTSAASLEKTARKFWADIKSDQDYPEVEARAFVVTFLFSRLADYINLNTGLTTLEAWRIFALEVEQAAELSFHALLRNPRGEQFVNLQNQFLQIMLALLAARRLAGVLS